MIHSFPFYIADWRDSSARLRFSSPQKLLYLELLFWCWKDGSLPASEQELYRISGMDKREFFAAWKVVQTEFYLQDGVYRHHKVDEKRQGLEEWNQKRKQAGSRGGSARAIAQAIAKAKAQAKSKPSTSTSLSTSSTSTPLPPDISEAVASLRTKHPQHRTDSETVIVPELAAYMNGAVNPESIIKQILDNHALWCESEEWTKQDGKFVPRLSKWLREMALTPPQQASRGWVDGL